MIVKPKVRGFICTTAHPEGCKQNVKSQIDYITAKGRLNGSKNALIIGCSTGFGLSSRITAAFGCGANTYGVSYEKSPTEKSTATAGYYNNKAFDYYASKAGLNSFTHIGDAFSNECKSAVINAIINDGVKIDTIIYSIASPRRTDPQDGTTYSSVIKPTNEPFVENTVNFHSGEVSQITVPPATEEEINGTIKVMGGEDWQIWIHALKQANLLAEHCITLAYSYIGPTITHPVYKNGTIGKAKEHLALTAKNITNFLSDINGHAYVSVNKALVTQASSAIPVVPLYISILFKVMKAKGVHEGCIEQIDRLFRERLFGGDLSLDAGGLIRIDDLEMREDVQQEVMEIWNKINSENISSLSDLDGYTNDFYKLFGFNVDGIDYDAEVDIT